MSRAIPNMPKELLEITLTASTLRGLVYDEICKGALGVEVFDVNGRVDDVILVERVGCLPTRGPQRRPCSDRCSS